MLHGSEFDAQLHTERSLVTNKRRSLPQLFYDLHHELLFGNENISGQFGCGANVAVTCFTIIATLALGGGGECNPQHPPRVYKFEQGTI